jgi:Pyruvate/2-oxoacid:ferredoxin oxidoreductase gamma subunit
MSNIDIVVRVPEDMVDLVVSYNGGTFNIEDIKIFGSNLLVNKDLTIAISSPEVDKKARRIYEDMMNEW